MTARSYSSPEAFKQALEHYLRSSSMDGRDFARRRQLLVYERFLARIDKEFSDAATLKGGVVLELRLARARTTKDVDLRMVGAPGDLLPRLQRAGRLELGDFMSFEIVPDPSHPEIRNEGMLYEGLRFRAECKISNKVYGSIFGVDVSFGDPIFGEVDVLIASDRLAFAGVEPPSLRVYPLETHIAEKLHAYTQPRDRPNSRVKDLPDLALLATVKPLEASALRHAIDETFRLRKTHTPPRQFPMPLSSWSAPYAEMALENGLSWRSLEEVTHVVSAFLNPVLEAPLEATWNRESWNWQRH